MMQLKIEKAQFITFRIKGITIFQHDAIPSAELIEFAPRGLSKDHAMALVLVGIHHCHLQHEKHSSTTITQQSLPLD